VKQPRADVTTLYTSEDGTVYDSRHGWRIESYGSDKVLAREVDGTLDDEIVKGRDRAAILTASRDAIARLVRRGAKASGRAAGARRALGRMSKPSQRRIGPNGGVAVASTRPRPRSAYLLMTQASTRARHAGVFTRPGLRADIKAAGELGRELMFGNFGFRLMPITVYLPP
jgi:hypothetical protein